MEEQKIKSIGLKKKLKRISIVLHCAYFLLFIPLYGGVFWLAYKGGKNYYLMPLAVIGLQIATQSYYVNKLVDAIVKKYIPCPYCDKSILVKVNWQCDYCDNYQDKETFISEKCDHCHRRVKTFLCEHCDKEFRV